MTKKIIIWISYNIVLLLSFSCKFNEGSVEDKVYDFSVESKFISTGNKLGHFYYFNQTRNDSLFVFNVFNHSLEIIDLNLDKIVQTISFELNGPNAVDNIRGFYYHTKDSIFLAEGNSSVTLMNSAGDLIERYFHLDQGMNTKERAELYDVGPNLEFTSQLLFNPSTKEIILYYMSFDQPEKKRIFSAYSILTKKVRSFPIFYPSEFENKRLNLSRLFTTSATLIDNKLVFIFSNSPNINKFDFKNEHLISKTISPSWEKTVADPLPFGPISDEEKKTYMANNPYYFKIYHDPFRKLYYRLSSPPRNNFEEDDFHYVFYNKILLTVLDYDFNIIHDFFLPKENIYNVGFSFVTSKGLWISYNSKNQNEENLIKGDLIRIVYK